MAIVIEQGGVMLRPTVAAPSDDSLMVFLPRVDGIGNFSTELSKACWLKWQGMRIPVLPLKRILASKQFLKRSEDLAHIPLLKQTLRLKKIVFFTPFCLSYPNVTAAFFLMT